jgi:hypothetical protein
MNQWRITSHEASKISVPVTQSVGTTHAPDVRDATRVHRWRVVVALLLAVVLVGCIPGTIRPQFDDENKPIAIPVTPTGSISPDGTLTPIYPVSSKSPQPTNWAAIGIGISAVLNAVLMAYGINLRGALGKAVTVARIGMELADANAAAETDEDVRRNKEAALQKQRQANVHKLTQELRGKT